MTHTAPSPYLQSILPVPDAFAVSVLKNARVQTYLASSPQTPPTHVPAVEDSLARSFLASALVTTYLSNPSGHAALIAGTTPPCDDATACGFLANARVQSAFA